MKILNNKAQSTIEFTFAMIVVLFLIYGMIMVFRWAGMDLANRRYMQDKSLTGSKNPVEQLTTDAGTTRVLPMAAVYRGKITDGNISK